MRKKDVMKPLIIDRILKDFKWSGTEKIWLYTLEGVSKEARIKLSDFIKIIRFSYRK